MGNITFSTPFTKSFTHTDVTVGTTASEILATTANPYDKRILLLIQNQHASDVVEVIFGTTGSSGIMVYPTQSITLENYNGAVRAISSGASTPVHIAYAQI